MKEDGGEPSGSFFVTSTGTEVGKTVASTLFVRVLEEAGNAPRYVKPVASGCRNGDWGYRSPDEDQVLAHTGLGTESVRAHLRFEAPLSPDKAAERENRTIDFAALVRDCRGDLQGPRPVVFEGIGGVAVPFGSGSDVTDLIAALSLPALLVVSSRLGTISHTRTAAAYLESEGARLAGILLTPGDGDPIEETNRDHLREFFPGIPVRLLPRARDREHPGEALEVSEAFLEEAGM